MAPRARNWKAIAGIVGAVGLAVVAIILLRATIGGPEPGVVATVNRENITAEDVARMQARYLGLDIEVEFEQALEQLITERLLYQEAQKGGHLPSVDEAEQELGAQLERSGWSLEYLQEQLELSGVSYDEYLETFRRELAIRNYLDAAIVITDEQARKRYDEYAKIPEIALPPFEFAKDGIIAELRQEARLSLFEELRNRADIRKYT